MTLSHPSIAIRQNSATAFTVTVEDAKGSTSHEVTVWPSDIARYAPDATPEALLEASFRFLLEREPKESILRRFDLAVIEQYFPDYARIIESLVQDAE